MKKSEIIPGDILAAIEKEVARAERIWPKWPSDIVHAAAIVGEESGELTRAALQSHYQSGLLLDAQKEAIQTAATAIRFLKNIEFLAERP